MVSFDANGPGTSRETWDASDRVSAPPLGDLSGARELIVVAAHPDDETLGCGGLIARAAALGMGVRIIAVTDGSASHPRSTTVTPQDLRAHRALELRNAAGRLAPGASTSLLGFPDGKARDCALEIEERLRTELGAVGPDTLVAVTWAGDGHRDHRVVGEIVARVLPSTATVWSYPIWMWHWATPDDESLPWSRAVTVALSAEELDRKRHAMDAYASQLEPLSSEPGDERVLEPDVLAHFTRDREVFFASPGHGRLA
jgi:LmbE family N-acetylglucosaminyl deacetylase